MNFKKTLFFGVVLAALVSYIVYVEVPSQNEELTKSVIVKNIAQEEFSRITISHGKESFELVNKNPHKPKPHDPADDVTDSNDEITGDAQDKTDWSFPDLPNAKLDVARVNAITSALATLTSTATINAADVEGDLSLYGLNEPSLVLTYEAQGQNKKLIFGGENEFAGERYLKVDGVSDLFLINNTLYEAAHKLKDDLRDKTPVSFSDASVSEITVVNQGNKVVIVPDEKRNWKLQQPISAKASTGAVYDLFRNLRNMQAVAFVDTPPEKLTEYGLDAPLLSVSLKRQGGDLAIDISRVGDKSWMRINKEGALYQITGDPTISISGEENVYREKQPFKFDNFFAKEISITKPDGKTLTLKKENDLWKIGGKEADAPFVRQYIKDLSDMKASAFPHGSVEGGFQSPLLTIMVHMDEGAESKTRTLYVGSKMSDGYYASVDDKSEVFIISEDSFKNANAAEERFLPVK